MKIYTFSELEPELREEIIRAEKVARGSVFPASNPTKVGCIVVADGKEYFGANIKRWTWIETTCAESLALDNALFNRIHSIDRIVIYGTSKRRALSEFVTPCGSCREKFAETLYHLKQPDTKFIIASSDKSKVVVANLTELFPLSGILPSTKVIT